MKLNSQQLDALKEALRKTEDEEINCEECLDRVAAFIELRIANQPLPDALRAVEQHLDSCPECAEEYRALRRGLRALEG